jgi:3-isopropylmalate/(R)-2-methylmalate dehydratase small subunit
MEPFNHLSAVALPVARINVDTDQIIPARYLQKPRAEDFGAWLFNDVRVGADGNPNADIPLLLPGYRDAKIVVAERNFGCGSSREHAVWALYDYGIRAAIAPSFGDIFATNATKNGLLPVVLPEHVVTAMIAHLRARPGTRIAVDLPSQTVVTPDGAVHRFDVDPFVKRCLREGLDEIAYTLTYTAEIEAFEARHARDDA